MKGLISTAMANVAGNSTKLLKRAARASRLIAGEDTIHELLDRRHEPV
jgi:hypothetical protein